jgi:alkylated DNA repair dioxygenase AlkB
MHIYNRKFIPDASFCSNQVKIVRICQKLGVGEGGFYRPGYNHGAKLSLRMMCLGMNWDLDSRSYGHQRPFDRAQPPNIPEEFRKFVHDAIQVSHEFLEQSVGVANAAREVPPMSPDICIVNFYGSSGKLGLHQV